MQLFVFGSTSGLTEYKYKFDVSNLVTLSNLSRDTPISFPEAPLLLGSDREETRALGTRLV